MAKKALSECLLYLRTSLTTLHTKPALFRVLSTFQTGIGVENFMVDN